MRSMLSSCVSIHYTVIRRQIKVGSEICDSVFVVSEDAYDALPDERKDEIQQQLMHALDSLSDEPGLRTPRGVSWNTWRIV